MVSINNDALTEKILAGERITPAEALELYRLPLAELGQLATARKETRVSRWLHATGIPVGETQAGKGSLPEPHALCLGGIGATGTRAANVLARDADLVIVIGSRLSDFTTASLARAST